MRKLLIASALFAACAWGQPSGTNIVTLYGTPGEPTISPVTNTGVTGTTQYCYWAVAIYAGGKSGPAGPMCTFTANATLSASNFDTVAWLAPTSPLSAVTGYDILRTVSQTPPTGTCNCAVITNTSASPINDTSNTLSGYTVATATGSIQLYVDTMTTTTPTLTATGALKSTSGASQVTTTIPWTLWNSPPCTSITGMCVSATDIGSTVEAETAIYVGANATLTGACVMGGSAAGTDNFLVVLRNQAGTALAQSASTGPLAISSGLNCAAFTATVAVQGPALYFIGTQANGATANAISLYTNGSLAPTKFACGQVTGQTFGTVTASLAMPTSFTSAKCPYVTTY